MQHNNLNRPDECCGQQTCVIDSRPAKNYRIRRRQCSICKRRFSTAEITIAELRRLTDIEARLDKVSKLLAKAAHNITSE